MKRLGKVRAVIATSVVALVVAVLTFGVAHQVVRPSALQLSLTSGSGFTITSNIYSSPACSGPTAKLLPGVNRCLVYTVQNNLNVPITVQTINMTLDGTYPTPPSGCAASDLSLPTFSGSFNVAGGGTANSPGLPISLIDNGDQDNCENTSLHFTYTGTAQYADGTATALVSSSNPSTSGQSVTFTATVTAGNAGSDTSNPTGTVNFYSCPTSACGSTTMLGSGTISGGTATFSTASLAAGSTFVEAIYQGAGTNFTSSTSNVVTQAVNSSGVSTTTSLASTPNPSVSGSSVSFTATVAKTSGTGNPTGTVNFYSCTSATSCTSPALLGSGALSSGKATFSTASLPVGNTFVDAIYQGVSGSFLTSTSNVVTQVVTSTATTTSLTSLPNPSITGGSVTFTATVAKTSGTGTPTGTVKFFSCTTAACGSTSLLGSGTLSSGKATFSTSSLPVGSTFVEAVYQGVSGSFGVSTSNVVTQSVTPVQTTTSLTSSPNPSVSGGSVAFTATVSRTTGSGTPTGNVNFYSCTSSACGSTTLLGSGTLSSGKATFSTTSLPVGSTFIEAAYQGVSGSFGTSTSNVVSQVVTSIATSTSLTSTPDPSASGASVGFTATVTKTSGTGTPTGTVKFLSCTTAACGSTTLLGSATLSSGKATLSTSSLPVGSTIVEAVYQGVSGSFGSSTSNVVTQIVTAISTTTALTSTPNPSVSGTSVALSATVSRSSGSGTPGGSVSFFNGTPGGSHTLLGSGTLNSSGVATLNTSGLAVGTDSLYAVYAGAGAFTGSTSPVISQLVISPPATCTGSFSNVIVGNPAHPVIIGPSGNTFFYLFAADYIVVGQSGNDCVDTGNGNNAVGDGNGDDVIVAGNGNNGVLLGNGNDTVMVGNGSNEIVAANGNDKVSVGNGSGNGVILGNGNDTVILGTGSGNSVNLGNGNNTVTITGPGSNDTIHGGSGNETIFLGSGTNNTFIGGKGHNTCHLPAPPSSWHGTIAAFYHDALTNCTVVTP